MPFLDWVNKSQAKETTREVPYHLLKQEAVYGEPSDNLLIQGDNLLALKALIPFYAGQVKCIYIDPPYNTQSAFEHYDDKLEHSQWLTTLYPRLELLRELLAPDGSLWVSIDNKEGHYLKVLLDEVFGRRRYVTTCVWQQRTTRENRKVFSEDAEYIHVYAADPTKFKETRNKLTLTQAVLARYKNPDNDPRGPWQSVSANAQDGHATADQFYEYRAPSGKLHKLPAGRCWLYTKKRMDEEVGKNNIWFGKKGTGVPRIKKFLDDDVKGLVPETLPTGGGKTIMAAHSIALAGKAVLDSDAPLALWLTPSDTIRTQTLEALANARHPYRQALAHYFGDRVKVCDLESLQTISPHDVGKSCIVVVATIQSFNVSDTGKRNVYSFFEELAPHFDNLPPNVQAGLELVRVEELEVQRYLTPKDVGRVMVADTAAGQERDF